MKKYILTITQILFLAVFLNGCRKEPQVLNYINVRMSQGGSFPWTGIRFDPNAPSLCAGGLYTESRIDLLAAASLHYTGKAPMERKWLKTSANFSGPYHAPSLGYSCANFNIEIREKTYDLNTQKDVIGDVIATVAENCVVKLTVDRKPKKIYVKATPNFKSSDIVSGSEVAVENFGIDYTLPCN